MTTSNHEKRTRPRLTAVIVGTLVLAILAVGARWTYWAFVTHRFNTVSEGRVYTTGSMSAEELEELVEEHGIRTVVDFRMPGTKRGMKAATQAAILERLGVAYHRLPTDQVPEDSTVSQFLDITADDSVEPMLLQCAHGAGRSVLFGAIYRIEYEGWSNERARSATKRFFSSSGSFAPSSEKGRFLLDYAEDPTVGLRDSTGGKESEK